MMILFCFVISFVCLSVCSKNSFLYPFNDWVDENAFFTIGRGWLQGMVPYRDLIDQKGPLLYFIFVVASLISYDSFAGAFIIEIFSMTICLYYATKVIELYLDRKFSYLILPLFASIMVSCLFFVHGGSAEEFCFPLLMVTLYKFLLYFKEKCISNRDLFWIGLTAGCIFMIKYTLIGFWFAFMFCIFIDLVKKKKYKKSIISCLWFLLGMFIPIIVFVGYFWAVHSLKEFVDIYVLFNKNNYDVNFGLIDRFKNLVQIFLRMLKINFVIFNLIDVGILYFVFSKKLLHDMWSKLSILIFVCCGVFTVYYGCKEFTYYFLIFIPLCLFGFIALGMQIDKLFNSKIKYGLAIIVVLILSSYFVLKSNNLYYMKYNQKDLVQYKFADIIKSNGGKTLLNYGFLDGGFYLTSNILPSTKYFMLLNADIPEMEAELTKKIGHRKFDYIVVRSYEGFEPTTDVIRENYELVATDENVFEGRNFVYDLYQKKEGEL